MRRLWIPAAVVAAVALLFLVMAPPGPPDIHQVRSHLLAHPEIAPLRSSMARLVRVPPDDLPALAASQPVIYGNLSSSVLLYRAEFREENGTRLVIYDAGRDRIERVFNLLEGRLE